MSLNNDFMTYVAWMVPQSLQKEELVY